MSFTIIFAPDAFMSSSLFPREKKDPRGFAPRGFRSVTADLKDRFIPSSREAPRLDAEYRYYYDEENVLTNRADGADTLRFHVT
jgi:hypothetical protein